MHSDQIVRILAIHQKWSQKAWKGPDQANIIYICTWCEKLFSLHFSSNPLLWGLPLLLNLILRTISSLSAHTIWSGCWVRCLQIHRNCNLSCFQEDETDQMSHALLETTTIDWKTTPCKIGCGSSFHYLRLLLWWELLCRWAEQPTHKSLLLLLEE